MKEILVTVLVHSNKDNITFLSGRALEDFTIEDKLYLEDHPESIITIERLEMYRKDVTEVPKAYGVDITLKVPEGIDLKPDDVLCRIEP
jgi:hypothetical protein